MLLLQPANEVCEGYVFTGVCLSTLGGGVRGFIQGGVRGFIRGGRAWFYSGACMVLFGGGMHGFIRGRGACMVLFRGACVVLFGGWRAWFYSGGRACFFQFFRIQWDTVNERAVRILLECILFIRKIPAREIKPFRELYEEREAAQDFDIEDYSEDSDATESEEESETDPIDVTVIPVSTSFTLYQLF